MKLMEESPTHRKWSRSGNPYFPLYRELHKCQGITSTDMLFQNGLRLCRQTSSIISPPAARSSLACVFLFSLRVCYWLSGRFLFIPVWCGLPLLGWSGLPRALPLRGLRWGVRSWVVTIVFPALVRVLSGGGGGWGSQPSEPYELDLRSHAFRHHHCHYHLCHH